MSSKILFITSNRIGDAVLSTGLLGWLQDNHPEARFTVACGPAPAPLFEALPRLERLIVLKKGALAAHWRHLWIETVGTWWDLVVDLRASAFAYLVPTRRRLVFRPTHDPIHRVRQLAALTGVEPPPAPRLWASEAQRAEARRLVPEGGPVLAVGPTANWGGKTWPADRFIETIARLTAKGGLLPGARVAVFGAPHERQAALPVLDSIPGERRLDLIGAASLPVIHACLTRCALYIGNDSGLMHMAAASGIPTLGLFGPSNEALYAPWGEVTAFIRGGPDFHDVISRPGYDPSRQDSLMTELTVDAVMAATETLAQSTRP